MDTVSNSEDPDEMRHNFYLKVNLKKSNNKGAFDNLTFTMLHVGINCFKNCVDSDQLASKKSQLITIRINTVLHSALHYKLTSGILQVKRMKLGKSLVVKISKTFDNDILMQGE